MAVTSRGAAAAAAAALLASAPSVVATNYGIQDDEIFSGEKHGKPLMSDDAYEVLDGCYYQDSKYDEPAGTGKGRIEGAVQATDHVACQKVCAEDSACTYFTFYSDSKNCYKLSKDAVFHWRANENAMSGPKFCPEVPSGCTEIASKGFPGQTEDETDMMFPSHRQPTKMECWPRNQDGSLYNTCDHVTILEDAKYGWPGLCMGLIARSGPQKKYETPVLPAGETCESDCLKNPECSVWVVVDDKDKACWQGVGSNCYVRHKDFPGVIGAQRVMHGEVRVIATLTDTQLWGLTKAFGADFFVTQEPDAVNACRNHCYSNIRCQYWQYSTITGCWTEEASYRTAQGSLQYPLTKEKCTDGSHMASFIIAGEYIQHVCPGKLKLPSKFSNSLVPGSLNYVAPPNTIAQIYKKYEKEFPQVHGAPPKNSYMYGSAEYHNAYLNAGVAAKNAAYQAEQQSIAGFATPKPTPTPSISSVFDTPAPTPFTAAIAANPVTTGATGPVVQESQANAIANANAQRMTIVGQRLYEDEEGETVAESASSSSLMAVLGGAALAAVAGMSVLAFRRARSPSLRVNVAMELATQPAQQSDSEQPLMPNP